MAQKIQFKRGNEANLPVLDTGEPAVTLDSQKLFYGTPVGNVEVAKKSDLNATNANVSANAVSLADNATKVTAVLGTGVLGEMFPILGGETDDTARIGRAITSLGLNGVLRFAQGKTYSISASIPLKSNIILDGNGATITNSSTSEIYFFTLYGCKNVIIKNFVFDGNNSVVASNVSGSARKPMLYGAGGGISNISIRNNIFQNGTGGGILLYGVSNSDIEENIFTNMNYNAISTLNSVSLVRINGNKISNSYGIAINLVESTANVLLTPPSMPASASVQTNTFNVPVMVYVSSGTIQSILINGAIQDNLAGNFLLLPNDTIAITYTVTPTWQWNQCGLIEKVTITENMIYNMTKSGSDYAMGIQTESSSDGNGSTFGKVRRCVISNNIIDTCTDMGMSIAGCVHMIVNGNYIKDITGGYGAGIENVVTNLSTFVGNIVKNCSKVAYIFDRGSDCVISGNVFQGFIKTDYTNEIHGMEINGSSTFYSNRNVISDNLFDGWTYSIYLTSGYVKSALIQGNRFNNSFKALNSTSANVSGLDILDNLVVNPNNTCFTFTSLTNSKISGNKIKGGGSGVGYQAMFFSTGNSDLLISDNFISDIGFGIHTASGTSISSSAILNNYFSNCGTIITDANITTSTIKGNKGYNPKGNQTAPTIPSSASALTNPFLYPCRVFVSGGTVTQIAINGANTGLTSGQFLLEVGDTITLTYSVSPTWVWLGQ